MTGIIRITRKDIAIILTLVIGWGSIRSHTNEGLKFKLTQMKKVSRLFESDYTMRGSETTVHWGGEF